jgi:hypothetical protein
MSLEHSPARDKEAGRISSERLAFTIDEFVTDVFPMSRAAFYQDVGAGLIKILKRGHRSYVTVEEARAYPARLAARNAADTAAA